MDLEKAQRELLAKRKRIKKAQTNTLDEVKKLLLANNHSKALVVGEKLRDSDLWDDVIKAFTDIPPDLTCQCGTKLDTTFIQFNMSYLKHCPVCAANKKEKKQKAEEKGKAAYKKRVTTHLQSYLEKKANVPLLFATSALKYQMHKSIDTSKSYFLHGLAGRGKTQIAVDIMAMKILDAEPVRGDNGAFELPLNASFVSVPRFLREIKNTFEKDSDQTDMVMIKKHIDVDLLVLDDLGVEKTTDWVLETLYILINSRYENMRQTIITSNLILDDLAGKMHDRISSRLDKMCISLELDGPDWRLNGKT